MGGNRAPSRDHLFPESRGFRLNSFEGRNKVICCEPCNASKGDRHIVEWLLVLRQGNDLRARAVERLLLAEFDVVVPWHAGTLKHKREKAASALRRIIEKLGGAEETLFLLRRPPFDNKPFLAVENALQWWRRAIWQMGSRHGQA